MTQVQNNVMVLDNQTFSVAAAGETINLPFKSNVQVTPSSDVAWITVAQTKAVEDHIFSITVAANDAYEGREGHVTFTSTAGNASITIKQEAAEEPSDGIIRILASMPQVKRLSSAICTLGDARWRLIITIPSQMLQTIITVR